MAPSQSLAGQTALVTGASQGIGAAIAMELAAHGARVAVDYMHSRDGADAVVSDITEAGGTARAFKSDVSDPEAVGSMFQEIIDNFGALDILVANAGIQKDAAFMDMSFDDWRKVLSVDLSGTFLCAREAARIFSRQGIRPGISRAAGKIVCISSVHQIIPWAGHVNYAAAKGGVQMLMKSMAQELAPLRIRVNSIAPGAIKTAINKAVWGDESKAKKLLNLIPYGRIGEPEDVAKAAAWLASDEADYVTGTTLFIDGGMTLLSRLPG